MPQCQWFRCVVAAATGSDKNAAHLWGNPTIHNTAIIDPNITRRGLGQLLTVMCGRDLPQGFLPSKGGAYGINFGLFFLHPPSAAHVRLREGD
jgi:hypothetical protein